MSDDFKPSNKPLNSTSEEKNDDVETKREIIENAIQIASDLHLEFGETLNLMPKIIPESKILC